ncbi:hypothetical protein [Lactococcus fujiensis]
MTIVDLIILKKRVIKDAIKEINSFTHFNVEYEKNKKRAFNRFNTVSYS